MKSLGSDIKLEYTPKRTEKGFKSRRDELVSRITDGINTLRVNTPYKPVSKRTVALILNLNPALAKSDDEVELLAKECESVGNYKKFWWLRGFDKKK